MNPVMQISVLAKSLFISFMTLHQKVKKETSYSEEENEKTTENN